MEQAAQTDPFEEAYEKAIKEARNYVDHKPIKHIDEMHEYLEMWDNDWWEENERRNGYFMDVFCEDMEQAGLKDSTIGNHVNAAGSFLNTLARRNQDCMEDCAENVHDYMGNWFIRRCMWSKPSNMKSTGTSIKKFLKSMRDHNFISPEVYEEAAMEIKDRMKEWIFVCACYNNQESSFTESTGMDMETMMDYFDFGVLPEEIHDVIEEMDVNLLTKM